MLSKYLVYFTALWYVDVLCIVFIYIEMYPILILFSTTILHQVQFLLLYLKFICVY